MKDHKPKTRDNFFLCVCIYVWFVNACSHVWAPVCLCVWEFVEAKGWYWASPLDLLRWGLCWNWCPQILASQIWASQINPGKCLSASWVLGWQFWCGPGDLTCCPHPCTSPPGPGRWLCPWQLLPAGIYVLPTLPVSSRTEVTCRPQARDETRGSSSFLAPNPEVSMLTICDLSLTKVTEPSWIEDRDSIPGWKSRTSELPGFLQRKESGVYTSLTGCQVETIHLTWCDPELISGGKGT